MSGLMKGLGDVQKKAETEAHEVANEGKHVAKECVEEGKKIAHEVVDQGCKVAEDTCHKVKDKLPGEIPGAWGKK